MKYLFLVIMIFGLFNCNSKRSPSDYRVEQVVTLDSIKFSLVNSLNEIIDRVHIVNKSQVLENSYFKLKLPKNDNGWSCKYKREITEYTQAVERLSKELEIEQRFLNKIIIYERLKKGHEHLVLRYWKQLNFDEWVMETDLEWNNVLDTYYNNFIINIDTSNLYIFRLDTCEIDMYKLFFRSLKNKNNNEFYIVKPILKSPVDLESNISMPYKKMLMLNSESGLLYVNITWDNFIFYR